MEGGRSLTGGNKNNLTIEQCRNYAKRLRDIANFIESVVIPLLKKEAEEWQQLTFPE